MHSKKLYLIFVLIIACIFSQTPEVPDAPIVRILIDDFGYLLDVTVNSTVLENEATSKDFVGCLVNPQVTTLGCISTLFLSVEGSPESNIESFVDFTSTIQPPQFTGGAWQIISPDSTTRVSAVMQYNQKGDYQENLQEGFNPPINFQENAIGVVVACESRGIETTIDLVLTSNDTQKCSTSINCELLGTFQSRTPDILVNYTDFNGAKNCDLTKIIAAELFVDIIDDFVTVFSVYVSGEIDIRPSVSPSPSLLPSLSPLPCPRGSYYNGRKCLPCDVDECPILKQPPVFVDRVPIIEVQWRIYHDCCISWKLNDIPVTENSVSLYLQYGNNFENELEIATAVEAIQENFIWKPIGIYPTNFARVKMILDSSLREIFSLQFEIMVPDFPPPLDEICI